VSYGLGLGASSKHTKTPGTFVTTAKDDYEELRKAIANLPEIKVRYSTPDTSMMAAVLSEKLGVSKEIFQKELEESRTLPVLHFRAESGIVLYHISVLSFQGKQNILLSSWIFMGLKHGQRHQASSGKSPSICQIFLDTACLILFGCLLHLVTSCSNSILVRTSQGRELERRLDAAHEEKERLKALYEERTQMLRGQLEQLQLQCHSNWRAL